MNSIYIILVSVSPVLYMLCMSSEDSWMIQFQLNLFIYILIKSCMKNHYYFE